MSINCTKCNAKFQNYRAALKHMDEEHTTQRKLGERYFSKCGNTGCENHGSEYSIFCSQECCFEWANKELRKQFP